MKINAHEFTTYDQITNKLVALPEWFEAAIELDADSNFKFNLEHPTIPEVDYLNLTLSAFGCTKEPSYWTNDGIKTSFISWPAFNVTFTKCRNQQIKPKTEVAEVRLQKN